MNVALPLGVFGRLCSVSVVLLFGVMGRLCFVSKALLLVSWEGYVS